MFLERLPCSLKISQPSPTYNWLELKGIMPGTVTFSNPNFPGNGKRGSVEMGKRQSSSTGTSGLLKNGGVIKVRLCWLG
jgi:hypothetical protein